MSKNAAPLYFRMLWHHTNSVIYDENVVIVKKQVVWPLLSVFAYVASYTIVLKAADSLCDEA